MTTVAISEAKAKLSELVQMSDGEDVILLRHGKPAAVIMSARRHAEAMEQLEDAEDSLAVLQAVGEPTIDIDELFARLGHPEAS